MSDAPVHAKILKDLEELLNDYKEAFAEDYREIGTTPLIKMFIDMGDHKPIEERTCTLPIKHYDGVRKEKTNYRHNQRKSFKLVTPIIVEPKGKNDKCFCVDYKALNAITRTYIWPKPKVKDMFS